MTLFPHFSEAVSLALHSMVLLGQSGTPLTTKEIATKTGASVHHLAKVFQRLGKAKLVMSARGPRGGFILARPPEEITLLEVYEAIEGSFETEGCLLGRERCPFSSCIFGGLLHDFALRLQVYLSSHRLSDVCWG
ncbi:MAG: RrF2 family transcriptional regulator [Candidatus Caldatribacteriaceae bacterium]